MKIRPEVKSVEMSKYRYYELKYFTLQYNEWKAEYARLGLILRSQRHENDRVTGGELADQTANIAIRRDTLKRKMELVEKAAKETGELSPYIFEAVTEDRGWLYMRDMYGLVCTRAEWYRNYHLFFYFLSQFLQAL